MPKALCRLTVALALLALAACGGEGTATASPTPSPSATSSSSPTPGKVFTFKLNPADATVTSKGTITLTAGPKTTTLELKITGLQASSSHVSHIHLGSCTGRGGIAFALNQVIADGQGNADTKTTLNITYPPATGKWYAVVHSGPDMQGTNSKYLLCGNLF
ncbi:MAG TPA: CHRD domain-containing protein [Candidatus Dormibacteraeota bacterium]|jgi:predicted small lipoprotein YifL